MTQEEKEGNIAIAKMLGFKTNREKSRWVYKGNNTSLFATAITGKHGGWITEVLRFHEDWNWMMEAINFIEKIKDNQGYSWRFDIYMQTCQVSNNHNFYLLLCANRDNKKEACFYGISQFAHLYNTNKL